MNQNTAPVLIWRANAPAPRSARPASGAELAALLEKVAEDGALARVAFHNLPGEACASAYGPREIGLRLLGSAPLGALPTPRMTCTTLTRLLGQHQAPRASASVRIEHLARALDRSPVRTPVCDRAESLTPETDTLLAYLWHQAREPLSVIYLTGPWTPTDPTTALGTEASTSPCVFLLGASASA